MNDRWTDRLSEYVDGELGVAAAAALEAHLPSCGDCRATLEELRRVVTRAGKLDDRPPTADLWPEVATRIGLSPVAQRVGARAGGRAPRRLSFTVPQLLAASIALVLLSGSAAWLLLRQPAGPTAATATGPTPMMTNVANVGTYESSPRYAAAVADLERLLAQRRSGLDPTTVRLTEKNMGIIDRAIRDAQGALGRSARGRKLRWGDRRQDLGQERGPYRGEPLDPRPDRDHRLRTARPREVRGAAGAGPGRLQHHRADLDGARSVGRLHRHQRGRRRKRGDGRVGAGRDHGARRLGQRVPQVGPGGGDTREGSGPYRFEQRERGDQGDRCLGGSLRGDRERGHPADPDRVGQRGREYGQRRRHLRRDHQGRRPLPLRDPRRQPVRRGPREGERLHRRGDVQRRVQRVLPRATAGEDQAPVRLHDRLG